MADGISTEGFFRWDVEGRGDRRSLEQALGLASSAALHGVVAVLLLLAASRGVEGSHGTIELVPVEIAATDTKLYAPAADLPQGEPPAQLPANSSPTGAKAAPDELETKIATLAQLRQPQIDQSATQPQAPSLMSDDAAPGRLAALQDFIRDQVERHWSLDLASLGTEEFSIPIRIEITSSGTVLKAEVVDTPRAADPLYQEIAASGRNAVLSASPLSLPAGQYRNVMELVLYLNPRESLR
jgi:hypothetical protein